MSVIYFKRISALHLLLQSCSCFSKNRSSKTESGVPFQLLQFITTVVMKADISGNLHISQFPFTCVATNTIACTTPQEQEPPSAAGLPIWVIKTMSCGTWVSTFQAVLWEHHKITETSRKCGGYVLCKMCPCNT